MGDVGAAAEHHPGLVAVGERREGVGDLVEVGAATGGHDRDPAVRDEAGDPVVQRHQVHDVAVHQVEGVLVAGVGQRTLVAGDAGQLQVRRRRHRLGHRDRGLLVAGTRASASGAALHEDREGTAWADLRRVGGEGVVHQLHGPRRVGPDEDLHRLVGRELVGDPPQRQR